MRKITHLILHHSGSDRSTVESMTRFHKLVNKWRDIGYHKIGYPDGSIHDGRRLETPGAHVAGMNASTLGYCLVGNLNEHAATWAAWSAAADWFAQMCRLYGLDPDVAILGHRETVSYVPKLLRTKKNCPGKYVNMDSFRHAVRMRMANAS